MVISYVHLHPQPLPQIATCNYFAYGPTKRRQSSYSLIWKWALS